MTISLACDILFGMKNSTFCREMRESIAKSGRKILSAKRKGDVDLWQYMNDTCFDCTPEIGGKCRLDEQKIISNEPKKPASAVGAQEVVHFE